MRTVADRPGVRRQERAAAEVRLLVRRHLQRVQRNVARGDLPHANAGGILARTERNVSQRNVYASTRPARAELKPPRPLRCGQTVGRTVATRARRIIATQQAHAHELALGGGSGRRGRVHVVASPAGRRHRVVEDAYKPAPRAAARAYSVRRRQAGGYGYRRGTGDSLVYHRGSRSVRPRCTTV